jgi:hypothetical protein
MPFRTTRAGLLLVAVVTSACSPSGLGECSLDRFVEQDTSGIVRPDDPRANCGTFTLGGDGGASAAGMELARRCALDAVAAGRPFLFVYDVPSADKRLRVGYTGKLGGSDGRLTVHQYVSAADPGLSASVSLTLCTSDPGGGRLALEPVAGCRTDVGQPCLFCNSPQARLLCGG